MPFMGRRGYWGQYYHQLLSLDENDFVGKPVRLPFFTADYSVGICWSPGEEYVVYFDRAGSWLVVIPMTVFQKERL